MPQFERYFGIDYSGAETPTSSLMGLRLYAATPSQQPAEVPPPPSPRKYWTRRGLAEWLAAELSDGPPTLVGIDHAFSFPLPYFEIHKISHDWPTFLDDFHRHWPTDNEGIWVRDVLAGRHGNGSHRQGNSRWRRRAELGTTAKSVFHFGAQGCVAHSTHAGLPWLRYLRQQLGERVHFWPFDGWTPPAGHSVIAEVYPALFNRNFSIEDRNPHQHDAYSVAHWMQQNDADGTLTGRFHPQLSPDERTLAQLEGWILGLPLNDKPPLAGARGYFRRPTQLTTVSGSHRHGGL